MQIYELGYLVLPSISEDSLPEVVQSLRSIVTSAGGAEVAGEEPFKQDLSYTMTKTVGASRYVVNDAYIGWIKFEANPEKVNEIKAEVEKMDEIIRFLLIKAPRETTFTFAEARKKMETEEEPVAEAGAEEEMRVQ